MAAKDAPGLMRWESGNTQGCGQWGRAEGRQGHFVIKDMVFRGQGEMLLSMIEFTS